MSAAEIKTTTDQKMQKSLEALKANLAKIELNIPITGPSSVRKNLVLFMIMLAGTC